MTRAFALLLAAILLPTLAWAGGPAAEERWYVVQMQGQRAGWMRETVRADAERVVSESEMVFRLRRDAINVSITVKSEFVETPEGKPVSMKSEMRLGAMPTTNEYIFREDGVDVISTTGKAKPGEVVRQPLPDGAWMTPRAAERHMKARIAAGDKEISLRSIDPSLGLKPATTTHKLVERTPLEVFGKTIPALKWTSTVDIYPDLTSTDYTDETGAAVRTETDLGGIKLTVLLADKDLALAKLDPPELLVSTLIKPDRPLENPRALRRAIFRLESTGDKLPDIPTLAAQTFSRIDDRSGTLTVDLDAVAPAPEAEVADAAFIECSSMISCADERVKAVTDQALKDLDRKTAAPAEIAERLRRFVYDYIDKKSLGVGFASAAEVAETRTGDCSEHGVLLAAMLRSAGIPSRVISGLVYVDGFAGERTVFGYHMWAQALIEVDGRKHWIDLDAALASDAASDATHIALAPSSLSDAETTNALVRLAPMIGTLRISVEHPK
jgi:transglutaminase-like putative cysteine protease